MYTLLTCLTRPKEWHNGSFSWNSSFLQVQRFALWSELCKLNNYKENKDNFTDWL